MGQKESPQESKRQPGEMEEVVHYPIDPDFTGDFSGGTPEMNSGDMDVAKASQKLTEQLQGLKLPDGIKQQQ